MKGEIELHQRESSDDTERHLKENSNKFESDCMLLLKLMIKGKRLTTQEVRDMKIDDRRLRNLHESGKCKREWMFNARGKRTHVEYYIPIQKPPTKAAAINFWKEKLIQQALF